MTPLRRNGGLLAAPEARALDALLPLLPRRITPDMLSVLGLLGAVIAALGFALAAQGPGWCLVAVLGLGINWFGDSLDGRLARHRGVARPRRGYILDNGLDMLGYLALAVGFAWSGLVWPTLPFIAVALHFMLVNLAAARLAVTNVLDLSAGPIGTTELRVIFVGVATLLAVTPPAMAAAQVMAGWTTLDLGGWAWVVAMGWGYATALRADLREATARDGGVAR